MAGNLLSGGPFGTRKELYLVCTVRRAAWSVDSADAQKVVG
jgi:hypothetical protein